MKTLLELLGIATFGFIGFAGYSVYAAGDWSPACSKTAAELHSRGIVRQELKTPSTAQFGSRRITEGADCTFRIEGVVDAHNSYGATVRSRYVVVLQQIDGKWVRL